MILTLYHRTTDDAAAEILARGFRDRPHPDGVSGVWVSSHPVDRCDGPKGAHLLAIDTDRTPEDLVEYDRTDDGRGFAEWCIPAQVLNGFPRRSVPPEEEATIGPFAAEHHVRDRYSVWKLADDRPRAGRWCWAPIEDHDPDAEGDPPWFEDHETMEQAEAAAAQYLATLDS